MALSDACFEFLTAMKAEQSDGRRRQIAHEFAEAITHYSDGPFKYGDEIETLAYACGAYIHGGPSVGNDDPLSRLMFLAEAVQEGLDMPPPSTSQER